MKCTFRSNRKFILYIAYDPTLPLGIIKLFLFATFQLLNLTNALSEHCFTIVMETINLQKPRGDLPETLDPEDFVNPPKEDRRCVKCHRVPTNPQCSSCCNTIYCQPCSKTKIYCVTHHGVVDYTDDKKLRSKILDLRLKCPNWRGGCQYKDTVSKVYRQHLPECQIQSSSIIGIHVNLINISYH